MSTGRRERKQAASDRPAKDAATVAASKTSLQRLSPATLVRKRPRDGDLTLKSLGGAEDNDRGTSLSSNPGEFAIPTPIEAPSVAASGAVPSAVELTEEEYLRKITSSSSRKPNKGGAGAESTTERTGTAYGANQKLMSTDPIYRILHQAHRSDVVEVVRSKFGEAECARAAKYLHEEFTSGPVRRLRLQLNVPGSESYMGQFYPFLSLHLQSLRLLDLSRNQLGADDVLTLSRVLQLSNRLGSLEVLDLSCNRGIGNDGATIVMKALAQNDRIRAVILKHISLDDAGAGMIAPYLAARPIPTSSSSDADADKDDPSVLGAFQWTGSDQHRARCNFFVNVNENCLGPSGLKILGRCLPEHVSLTAIHQRPRRVKSAPPIQE